MGAPARVSVRGSGRGAPPRISFEELEIRTADGAVLRASVEEPSEAFEGTCILAHAAFTNRRAFGTAERPGLAQSLSARGWRTVAFDFRGRGDSTPPPGTTSTYDELVRFDLPAVIESAQSRSEGKPVVVVGHSLGGHVALAAQGAGRASANGILLIATSVWVRALEPSPLRWTAKRALARIVNRAAHSSRVPDRIKDLAGEPLSHVVELLRYARDDVWRSLDGSEDYLANLSKIEVPVCAVASKGDLLSPPANVEMLARRCRGDVFVVEGASGHAAILSSEDSKSTLLRAFDCLAERVRQARP